MESQIDMVPVYRLCGKRVQQKDSGLCSPWCQTRQSLPVYQWCPSSCHPGAGAQREWVWVGESVRGFPKKNCLGLQQPPPLTQCLLVFATRSCRDLSSWHWNPGLGAWCGSGTHHSQDIPPEFLSTWVWGHPVPHLCPSYPSGWMWFLQFHSCQISIQLDFWHSWVIVV